MDGLHPVRTASAGAESREWIDRHRQCACGGAKLQTVSDGSLGRTVPHRAHLRFAARPPRFTPRGHAEGSNRHVQLSPRFSGRSIVGGRENRETQRRASTKIDRGFERLERNRRCRLCGGFFSSCSAPGGHRHPPGTVPWERNESLSVAEHDVSAENSYRPASEVAALCLQKL